MKSVKVYIIYIYVSNKMDDIKMICGNNNILNMLGIGNQYNMYGGFGIGNQCGGLGNFNIFGNGFGGYSSYGNCCGDFNYDRAAGFMLGQSLVGIAFAAIGSLTGDSKANSKEALTTNLESLNKQIDTELAKIGKGITESNYANHKATDESWYKDGIKTANDTITEQKNIMDSVTTIDTDRKTVANHANAKKDLEAKISAETDTTKKAQLQSDLQVLNADYINATNNVKKYDDAKAAHDKAVQKKEALENEAKSEQEKIDIIAKKITELIEQRKKVQGDINTKNLNKADGNIFTRASEEKYENNVKYDSTTGKATVSGEVNIRYARLAVKKYSVAQKTNDVNGMNQAKAEFLAIYNVLDTNDKDKLADAYNLLK